jgi:hypothetical protein
MLARTGARRFRIGAVIDGFRGTYALRDKVSTSGGEKSRRSHVAASVARKGWFVAALVQSIGNKC